MKKERPRVLAIVQARAGANGSRAAFKSQSGEKRLSHTIARLKRSKLIDDIVIATGTGPHDDPIAEFALQSGTHVVRGSEDDALSCFARTAEAFDADLVVRVPSGTPEPEYVDHLLNALIAAEGDYVLPQESLLTHDTAEAFSRRALDRLMMDARTDLLARKEVTGYFRANPDFVRVVRAPSWQGPSDSLKSDEPDKAAYVDSVRAGMDAQGGEASLRDLLTLLEREAERRELDGRARRHAPLPQSSKALICCESEPNFPERVRRALSLGDALKREHGIEPAFVAGGTGPGFAQIERAGYRLDRLGSLEDMTALSAVVESVGPHILVLDCKDGPSPIWLKRLGQSVPITATIEDVSSRRLAASVAYYTPLPRAERLDWRNTKTIVRLGWRWSLFGTSASAARLRPVAPRPTLLVNMGASDPTGLTIRTARALATLPSSLRVRFIIGRAMPDRERAARAIVALKPGFETIEGADDLSIEYATADLALIAFGPAAYELASLGVPSLYLGLTDDDALAASAFEHAGMGVSLGAAATVSDDTIAEAVKQLLSDPTRRRDIRAAALMTIDSQGVHRIAADLAQLLALRLSGVAAAAG